MSASENSSSAGRGSTSTLSSSEHLSVEQRRFRRALHARLFDDDVDPVQIEGYHVLKRVGRGGMGVVYAAYDTELDRKVALKLLQRPGRGVKADAWGARLRREAQALARLDHPNTIRVYRVGEYDGQLFLVMEFVDGSTMRSWLEAKPRSWREIVAAYAQAGRGLAAAHASGVVHRDLKPDNILMGADGRVRVVDFGLARGKDERAIETPVDGIAEPEPPSPSASSSRSIPVLTPEGGIPGTPPYMAPEQLDGGAPDPLADQFSFCVALYEALYGERPFSGRTRQEMLAETRRGELAAPPRGTRVPNWVRKVLLRGLKPETTARFVSMDDLLEALGKDPLLLLRRGIGVAALGLVLLGGYWLWQRSEDARAAAEQFEEVASNESERAVEAGEKATDREDRLILAEAGWSLHTDPTEAVARLKGLSTRATAWTGRARTLAAHAHELGVARRVSTLPEGVSIALAPDGKWLISRDHEAGTVSLIDLSTGTRKVLAKGTDTPPLAEFSADGAMLALQAAGEVSVMELASGDPVPLGSASEHKEILIAADGGLVATWNGDDTVRLWASPEWKSTPQIHEAPVVAVELNQIPGGYRVTSVDELGHIRALDTSTGKVRRREGAAPIGTSADGRWLTYVGMHGEVVRYDHESETGRTLLKREGVVTSVAITPDGSRVAVGLEDGRIVLAGVHASLVLVGHGERVTELTFVDDELLLSRRDDRSLAVYQPSTGRFRRLRGHQEVGPWAIGTDGRLFTVGLEGSLREWDLTSPTAPVEIAKTRVEHLAWASEKPIGIAADRDGRVVLLPAAPGEVAKVRDFGGPIDVIALSPDGARAFVAGDGDGPAVWNLDRATAERITISDFDPTAAIAVDESRFRVVGRRDANSVLLTITAKNVEQLGSRLPGGLRSPAFGDRGRVLVFADAARRVHVWRELDDSVSLLGTHSSQVQDLAMTRDGRMVVAGGVDGTLRIWDLEDEGSRTVHSGEEALTALAWVGPNDDAIAVGGEAGWVRFIQDPAPHDGAELRAWLDEITSHRDPPPLALPLFEEDGP